MIVQTVEKYEVQVYLEDKAEWKTVSLEISSMARAIEIAMNRPDERRRVVKTVYQRVVETEFLPEKNHDRS